MNYRYNHLNKLGNMLN